MQKIRKNRTVPKTTVEDETSLDCEACFRLKLKKVKVEPKLPFYLILTYMLLAPLFGENHLLLTLGEAFLFLFGE